MITVKEQKLGGGFWLPFKYEEEKKDTGMTGLAGLPVYMDLASVMGLKESIERHLHIKQQSWTDSQTLISLILTNLAGGDCVDGNLPLTWP